MHRVFAAIVVLLAFYVAFASRFYSIKVFHRFNNIERDRKFYLISEKLRGWTHYMYYTLSIPLLFCGMFYIDTFSTWTCRTNSWLIGKFDWLIYWFLLQPSSDVDQTSDAFRMKYLLLIGLAAPQCNKTPRIWFFSLTSDNYKYLWSFSMCNRHGNRRFPANHARTSTKFILHRDSSQGSA